MIKPALALLVASLFATPALADADLEVSFIAPATPDVYTTARYKVRVENVGDADALNSSLRIELPETANAPTAYVMGVIDGMHRRCVLVDTALECDLRKVRVGKKKTMWIDIALPASAADLEFSAEATTSSSENSLANNTASFIADQTFIATPIAGPVDVINEHCTGTGLTSFYECTVAPGSIMSHGARYNADGTVTITNPANTTVTGTWLQPTPDTLEFEYTDNGAWVARFSGVGVGGGCFEGVTVFPNGPWVAPYEICLQ